MVEDLPALPDSERLKIAIADTLISHSVSCPDISDYQRDSPSAAEENKLDSSTQWVPVIIVHVLHVVQYMYVIDIVLLCGKLCHVTAYLHFENSQYSFIDTFGVHVMYMYLLMVDCLRG